MIMSDGPEQMPRPDSIIPVSMKSILGGTVKVIYPLNAVWSTNKGFKDFNQRLKFSSRRVRAATISPLTSRNKTND
jgi:hypothetical protein